MRRARALRSVPDSELDEGDASIAQVHLHLLFPLLCRSLPAFNCVAGENF